MFQFPEFASCSYEFTAELLSFLIQKSPDRSLVADSPELIAGSHVFLRFLMPRHPPYTLSNLTTFIDHRQDHLRVPICDCRLLGSHISATIADPPPGEVAAGHGPIGLRLQSGQINKGLLIHRKGARHEPLLQHDSQKARGDSNKIVGHLNLNLIIHLSKSFKLVTPLLRALFFRSIPPECGANRRRNGKSIPIQTDANPCGLNRVFSNRVAHRDDPQVVLGKPDQVGVLSRAILLKLQTSRVAFSSSLASVISECRVADVTAFFPVVKPCRQLFLRVVQVLFRFGQLSSAKASGEI